MAEASWNAFFTEPPKETADSEMVKDKIATALIFARLCFRYGAVGIYQILDNSVVEWERIAAPVTKILAKDRNEVETLAKDAEIQAAVDYILGNGLFNACSDLEAVSKFELTSVQHLALTQVILRVKSPSNLPGELKKSGDQKTDKDEAAGATGPV